MKLSSEPYWRGIAAGDTVTYSTPQGQLGKGRVVMSFPTHVVLNIGGRYGTPKVVDENNFVAHKKRRAKP